MPYRGLSLLAHLLQGYLTLAWANTNLPALCLLQELLAYSFLVAVSLTSWNLTPHMDRPVQYKIQGDAMVALQSSVSLWPLLLYFFFFSPPGIMTALSPSKGMLAYSFHLSPLSWTNPAGLGFGVPLPKPQPGSYVRAEAGLGPGAEVATLFPFCQECFPSEILSCSTQHRKTVSFHIF